MYISKLLKSSVLVAILSLSLQADEAHHKFELIQLPHPMKIIMSNTEKLKIDDKQQKQFDAIMAEVPPKMHGMLDEAKTQEHAIKKAVMKEQKNKEDLAKKLDTLTELKRKITNMHIDVLNRVQHILDKTQYENLIKILKEKKQCKK